MRLAFALIEFLFAGNSAFAHKLYVEAKPSDPVRFEAYYEDNTPAQEAKITVFQGETVIAEGRTDAEGIWTCSLPAGHYQVKAETLGHGAQTTLDVREKPAEVVNGDRRAVN